MSVSISRAYLVLALVFPLSGGASDGTAIVRQPPLIKGRVGGSVHQLFPADVTLSGNAHVTGDLIVPGYPVIRQNGNAAFAGPIDFPGREGSASDGGKHSVTLNGNASIRHVVRGVSASDLSVHPASGVERPAGRDVRVGKSDGVVTLEPGAYGNASASGGGGVRLGIAGAEEPTVYSFNELVLVGESRLEVIGPVRIEIRRRFAAEDGVGSPERPDWLELHVESGSAELSAGARFYGYISAARGEVRLTGRAELMGGVAADRLEVGSNAVLRLRSGSNRNIAPLVELVSPVDGASFESPAAFALAAVAVDLDGVVQRVEFFGGGRALGHDDVPPFRVTVEGLAPGPHRLRARAVDNHGAFSDSAEITVLVQGGNLPPVVSLIAPADGLVLKSPAEVAIEAIATDPEGGPLRVDFSVDEKIVGTASMAPFRLTTPPLAEGAHVLRAVACDLAGATAASDPVTITVAGMNESPNVVITSPKDGTTYAEPASFMLSAAATDPDGEIASVQFFEGATPVGRAEITPYQVSLHGVAAGQYQYVARATDLRGAATDSVAITVNVSGVVRAPAIVIESPRTGAVYSAADAIEIQAKPVSDATPARVEFEIDGQKVGEVAASPFHFAWRASRAGHYRISVTAFDSSGISERSAPVTVTVLENPAEVPFVCGFEVGDGFALGGVSNLGWRATSNVEVVDGGQHNQHLRIVGDGAQVSRELSADVSGPVFADFTAKLSAGTNPTHSAQIQTSMACVALVGAPPEARLYVFDGDEWIATEAVVEINAQGVATDWMRITTRENYVERSWDLFLNGRVIAADVPSAFETFGRIGDVGVKGGGTGMALWDAVGVSSDNPLGIDTDRDGMTDEWEREMGLDASRNDRQEDFDDDGVVNIREWLNGTNPARSDTDHDTLPDGWESRHGTDPLSDDGALDSDGDGLSNTLEFAFGTNPTLADTDLDGIPDGWEKEHGGDPWAPDAERDDDLDGISNLEEFRRATDPNDFYNGVAPEVISLVGTNGELGPASTLRILIRDAEGRPIPFAPVVFTAISGGHRLAATETGIAMTEVRVRAEADGVACAWVRGGSK